MRKTKIICTIGPASENEEMLRKLIEAGMNVARFNFSHGTHEEHEKKFRRVVRMRREMGLPVATLLDTKGPEIRLRDFEGGKVVLEKGQTFTLTTEEVMGDETKASVTYKDLPMDVSVGGSVLIDDGLIGLRVDSKTETEVVCTVINGGPVSNHKGVNLPGADLSMPFISKQDRSDIEFGCRLGYDFIAASFTRTAKDVKEIREILNAHNSRMKIIAKIESVQGVNNISPRRPRCGSAAGGSADHPEEHHQEGKPERQDRCHCDPDARFHDEEPSSHESRSYRRRQRDL